MYANETIPFSASFFNARGVEFNELVYFVMNFFIACLHTRNKYYNICVNNK